MGLIRNILDYQLSNEYNKNIILNYIFRLLTIISGLISTRLILGYLGATLYGLWVTITSVISWMNSGDLGIGNGLRNELAKAYGEGDIKKQRKLISSAFVTMIKIASILFVIIVLFSEVFFRIDILTDKVRIAMYITSVFFCINLVLGVSQSVALSYQKSWLTSLTTCEIQVLIIIGIIAIDNIGLEANLKLYAIVNGICTTIPNIVLILILRHDNINLFTIKGFSVDSKIVKTIMNTGIQFFGIQICNVILYSTDNLIINKLFDGDMVTKYEIITKIYNTGTSLFSILLIALWSGVTYHIAQMDIKWVKEKIKELTYFWIIFSLGVLIISLFFNSIVKIWLGKNAIHYEWTIVTLFAIYCSMTAFSAIYVNVLNGLGEIKLQLIIAINSAIINIPLSVYFASGLGILGVKLATFISAAIVAIAMPIQTFYEIKKREIEHA